MKNLLRAAAVLPVWPLILLYKWGLVHFETAGQLLALWPGALGRWWRERWYRSTLDACGEGLRMEWMSAIRTPRARLGNRVYVGVHCWIGWADIGDDVLLGGHNTVLSGSRHHRFDRLDVPMREQGGAPAKVTIGRDVWIGNRALVMADVSPGTVVGAGAVVTKTFDPLCVLAGVPARVLRRRDGPSGRA